MIAKYVVDTNVALFADRINEKCDNNLERACIQKSMEFIKALILGSEYIIALDTSWDILNEYRKNFTADKPIANEFFKWALLMHNTHYQEVVVDIKKTSEYTYDEFPKIPELDTFDKSDRKFIAVAYKHPRKPSVVVAADTD